jgi:photosystem II stability/assembly factor-like uncharacterized protein
MIGRLVRPPAVFIVAVGALVIAAAATVISGPPVARQTVVTPSPRLTPIVGPSGLPPVITLASSPREGVLYAVLGEEPSQLFRTTDSGDRWTMVAALPTSRGQTELIADPVSPGAFYLVRGPTIYRFTDDDATLRPVPAPASARDNVVLGLLAIPPWRAGTIFWRTSERVIERTQDGGRSWTSLTAPGQRTAQVTALVAAPSTPGLLYAFSSDQRAGDGVVWHSLDYGEHWASLTPIAPAPLGNAFVPSLAVHPSNSDHVFAGTKDGVYVSMDGGGTWTRSWTAPQDPAAGSGEPVWRFAFDRNSVYASKLSQLAAGTPTVMSRDGGYSWKETQLGELGVRQIIRPSWPGAPLYIGTTQRGIYSSTDIAGELTSRSNGLRPAN